MMIEILYTGTLSGPDLAQLIQACSFQQDARFLGEQIPDHIVDEIERQNLLLFDWYSSAIECTRYHTGRIFQENYELRWERTGDQFQIIYLGSDQPLAALKRYNCQPQEKFIELIKDKKLKKETEKQYILFGTMLHKGLKNSENRLPYAEARIPRMLYYPLDLQQEQQRIQKKPDNYQQKDQLKRLGIGTIEYTHTESGQVFAYRFQSLQIMEFTTLNKGA